MSNCDAKCRLIKADLPTISILLALVASYVVFFSPRWVSLVPFDRWLTFVSDMANSVAWPIVVLTSLCMFKKSITEKISGTTEATVMGNTFKFEVQANANAVEVGALLANQTPETAPQDEQEFLEEVQASAPAGSTETETPKSTSTASSETAVTRTTDAEAAKANSKTYKDFWQTYLELSKAMNSRVRIEQTDAGKFVLRLTDKKEKEGQPNYEPTNSDKIVALYNHANLEYQELLKRYPKAIDDVTAQTLEGLRSTAITSATIGKDEVSDRALSTYALAVEGFRAKLAAIKALNEPA